MIEKETMHKGQVGARTTAAPRQRFRHEGLLMYSKLSSYGICPESN